jgi:hypothetical protein
MSGSRRVAEPHDATPPAPQMLPKHWAGTDGACDVPTLYYEQTMAAAGEAINETGLLALLGPAGLGKTFLVKSVGERIEIAFHYHECDPDLRGKQQAIAILRTLGLPHDPTESPFALQSRLVTAFASEPQVLALDELDRWSRQGVALIRFHWSQPGNQTTFFFVGEKIGQLIEANPAFDSRIEHRVKFKPLDVDQTQHALRMYHPAFDVPKEDKQLLVRIHHLTDGQFRLIAILLRRILVEAGPGPFVLSSDLLERAWTATGRGVA